MRIIHSAIALALVPCISEATEYACKLPTGGWESVEAASKAEALHTANQRWPKNKGCALGSAKDQFVTDPRLNRKIINDSYLRPFLPPDIKYIYTSGRANMEEISGFLCDSTGDLLPDNSTDKGKCFELESASMGKWMMRLATQQDHVILWRRSGADWQFWVDRKGSALIRVSPEARDYAKGRGFPVQESSVGSSTAEATPTDRVKDKIEKGLGSLLKGLGGK